MSSGTILLMQKIKKSFGGVQALKNVTLEVNAGEIHAICGENGAGKSTLMKILSGVYPHGTFAGTIQYDGQERSFSGIRDSESLGIIIIHQELALVPTMSIAENIFLGNEQAVAGIINQAKSYGKTKELLQKVGLNDSPDAMVGTLGIGKQQLVEIAKALSKDVKLLILDEPTASLNDNDSEKLLDLLLELKGRGVTSIIISHKLNEISRVADAITVIRDGSTVDVLNCLDEEVSEDRIVKAMVGRDLADRYPPRTPVIGDKCFEVIDWTVQHATQPDRMALRGINIHARYGEVVGIAGLMGSGRTELAMSIFGGTYGRVLGGQVLIDGQKARVANVKQAIASGIAYVTEDRKGCGLLLDDPIDRNISLAKLELVSRRGVIDRYVESSVAEAFKKLLQIRCHSVAQPVGSLSGGNQQKVVLSKWLFSDPKVLILDEPTRGVDVGAKFEIYSVINQAVADGKCVVMISSEMPELLGMCDRIYVMNEGQIVGEFSRETASQEAIMRAIVRNGAH